MKIGEAVVESDRDRALGKIISVKAGDGFTERQDAAA